LAYVGYRSPIGEIWQSKPTLESPGKLTNPKWTPRNTPFQGLKKWPGGSPLKGHLFPFFGGTQKLNNPGKKKKKCSLNPEKGQRIFGPEKILAL